MDEKKINVDQAEQEKTEEQHSAAKQKPEKEQKPKKEKRAKKPKKLRNQALLRRGGYAVAITAAVLAGLVVLNVLVGVLAKRVTLEFDMSADKENSITTENIDYLRGLDKEVTLTMCAAENDYSEGGYMAYYAQYYYGISSDASDYYKQTLTLLNKYPTYNNKITLRYVDTQSTEYTEITSKYPNANLAYGDIIVSCEQGGSERYKVVGFKDIYVLSEDSTYASYGYTTSEVTGNNLETAVTGAIDYVTSGKIKKIAVYTGHSTTDHTAGYQTLLTANNYEVTVLDDAILTALSDEYDAVVIAAPTSDFIASELDVLSAFLDNDDQLGKGLLFFADAAAPHLKNFYEFLEEWGIAVGEGILFETNSGNHIADDPTTMGLYPTEEESDLTSGMQVCITGYNAPLAKVFDSEGNVTVTTPVASLESVVAAPVGTGAGWTGAGDYTKQSYPGVLQSEKMTYNNDNQEIASYVFAFSSIEFIESEYLEYASLSNKEITLACAERAVGAEGSDISFISKTITNESYSDAVTESSANFIRILFMFLLPIVTIAAGVVIYIRRRNAQ